MTVLLALASSIVWGTSDFVAGLVSRRRPAAAVTGWSQALSLVLLTVIVVARPWPDTLDWLPWANLAGVAGAAGLVSFYTALATGTMGVVAPIAALGAAVPVTLGVLSGETPGGLAWVGMAVGMGGAALASGPELQAGMSVRPVALAVTAAGCFGTALFALDRGARSSLLHTLWGMRLTSVTLFVVIALVLRSVGGVRARDLPVLTAVGFADLAANTLFGVASASGYVSVASVLGSLYPVATILLARIVLGERLIAVQRVGVVLSMAGVVCIASAGAG